MKNIVTGILAHVDAGKTTLIESFLSKSGAIRKAGRVDRQTSVLDNDSQERERGITIYAKEAGFHWKDADIQVIDTPGHADFSSEMERSLAVLDLAILIISGLDGVQAHTRTIWKLLAAHNIPTLIFVNKMDLARRTESELIENIQKELSPAAAPVDPEQIAMTDDALLEKFMEGSLSQEDIRSQFAARKYFPILSGSALKGDGIEELLDALCDFAPETEWPDDFSATIYKVDENGTHLKVTGGALQSRQSITDELKADQIRTFEAGKLVPTSSVPAGSTCVVSGLEGLMPGTVIGRQTTASVDLQLVPSMEYEMLLPDGIDPLAIAPALSRLSLQDPTLQIETDSKTVRIRLMGEVQKEVLQKKIHDMTGLSVSFSTGQPVFKETVAAPVRGAGHFEPLHHYAEVHVQLEPLKAGSGIIIEDRVAQDALAPRFHAQILSALHSKRHKGVLTGSQLTDVKIIVLAARGHNKHTEGGDFRQASSRAVRQALMKADNVLLEPWSEFIIHTPETYFGNILYQLELKGAKAETGDGCITGAAPTRLITDFPNDLRALSKGQATMEQKPSGYRPVPDVDAIIEQKVYDPEADLRNPSGSVFFQGGSGVIVPWDESDEFMAISLDENVNAQSVRHRTYTVSDDESRRAFERASGQNRNVKKQVVSHKKKDLTREGQPVRIQERKPACMVIDGYNIINSWSRFRSMPLHTAREELIHVLSNYQGYLNERMIVVFDAWKVKDGIGSQERRGALEIVYTRNGQTADAYIEKLASVLNKSHRLTVCTSDGLIQNSVLAKGARRLSARELELSIESMENRAKEEFKKYLVKE